MTLRRLIPALMVALVVAPTPAAAHAAYRDSSPSDESTVTTAPSSVWAEYTEPLQEGSNIEIYDACGARVDHGDVSITGYRMTVSMTGEVAGTYAANWVAASAIDPHVTRGTFTFTVTDGDSCPGEAENGGGEDRGSNDEGTAAGGDDGNRGARTGSVRGDTSGDDVAGTRRERERADDAGARRGDRARTGNRTDRTRAEDGQTLAQQSPETEPTAAPGLFDIRWQDFLLGLAIAALIGAAAGRIYAGIMGPKR